MWSHCVHCSYYLLYECMVTLQPSYTQAPLITPDFSMHYQFLGSMLGKALYEGLLVELPFAGFFLCKLADRGRGTIGAHHLASFDAYLYR